MSWMTKHAKNLLSTMPVDDKASALNNNGRKKAVTLAEQNFRSERRMSGFGEDTSSNDARFKSGTIQPKPKADPKIKK